MRLLATFAAMATVNAYVNNDGILKRTRRDDDEEEGCGPDETDIDGVCTDNSLAISITDFYNDDSDDDLSGNMRRLSLGSDSDDGFGLERSKRRSQRITFVLALCPSGKCPGKGGVTPSGEKIKAREFMRRLNNYGCHCWTKGKDEGIGGTGKPVDDLDRTCADLARCHTCIGLEHGQGDACNPVTQKYKARIVPNKETGIAEISCTNKLNKKGTNKGDCKKNLCECDKKFAESFAENFAAWNRDYWQLNDEYDNVCKHTSTSRNSGGNNGPPNKCCGSTFPFMKPYNDQTHHCEDNNVLQLNEIY